MNAERADAVTIKFVEVCVDLDQVETGRAPLQ